MTAAMLALALIAGSVGATSDLNYVATISDGIQYPARLAAKPGGGFYVTDPPMKNVVEYDAAGDVVATYAIAQSPVGIAVHNDGRVFISREDGTIGVYDAVFALLGSLDPAPMTLSGPNDLAWDAGAFELYTVDSASHSVLVFTESAPATWTLARSWGMEGSGMGQFAAPQAIALDTVLGHILVTDADNFRVQVFDPSGILLFKFGYRILYTTTDETAWFARAEGLAVDDCGNIYLTDALMGTVRVFSATGAEVDGAHLPAIGYGAGAGQLSLPCDVMIDSGGMLYVANTNNGSVEVFGVTCSNTAAASTSGSSARGGKLKVDRGLMADLEIGRLLVPPDSPLEVVAALDAGEYDPSLDLDRNMQLDNDDIEIAVQMFGAGTVEDFTNVASHPAVAAPHILDMPNRCSRCHNMNGAPGGMLSAAGQENLCLSCHSAGKIAGEASIPGGHLDNSHPWGVPADIDPSSPLADHLDNGDVRCGTCHEPHENEGGLDFMRMRIYGSTPVTIGGVEKSVTVMDPTLCGECHADIADQWTIAGHADEHADPWVHYDWSLSSRSACRKCHSGFGYIDLSNGITNAAQQRGDLRVADCLVCHSTHGASQDAELLRVYDTVEMPGGITLTGVGSAATCMVCHNGRYAPADSGFTPHYLLGGAMLAGVNGITTFSGTTYTVTSSQHTTLMNAGGFTCATCHMAPGPAAGNPGAGKVGGHTFNMAVHDASDPDYGFENVTLACGGCHTGLATFNRTAGGDYDGDGTLEGVQDETAGLLDLVLDAVVAKGAISIPSHPYWYTRTCVGGSNDGGGCTSNSNCPGGGVCTDIPDKLLVEDAIWNWEFVDNSSDLGVKNTGYAIGLLQISYKGLTGNAVPGASYRYSPAP